MAKIKKIKIKQADGQYSSPIPLGADAENVDIGNGQTLVDLKNKVDSHTHEASQVITADGDNVEEKLSKMIEAIQSKLIMIKVWENANINSVFPEQTITLPRSLENNELLMILNEENAAIYLSNSSPQAYMYSHGFETLGARFSKLTGDKVQFYAGYTGNYNKYGSDATEDNSRVKPQAMYIVTDKSSGGITSLLLKEINDALTSKGSKPITNVNELPKAIADIPNLVGGNIEKIWENASSTSGFPAQTVIFDYSKYKWLIVESKRYYDSDNYRQSVLVRPENGISFRNTFTSGSNQQIITYYRTGTIRSNGIDFSSGWYATPTEDKEYIQSCIPMAIYGIKEPEPVPAPKPAGPRLVWTNASPNSSFPPQKVSIDLKDAKFVMVTFGYTTGESESAYTEIALMGKISAVSKTFSWSRFREFQPLTDGVVFQEGKYVTALNADWIVDNSTLIPLEIDVI